jgi:putative ATP-binding cassette transporter
MYVLRTVFVNIRFVFFWEVVILSNKELISISWQMVKRYFCSEEKWKVRGLLGAVIGLSLAQVYLLVLLNGWYNDFYASLQVMDYSQFWPLIGEFSAYAFIFIVVAVYAIYLRQMLQIKWRTWMTERYLDSWMSKQTYYRLQVLGKNDNGTLDNPDQRISEDINQFISLFLQLSLGLLKQACTLVAFVFILWDLSGILELPVGDTVIGVPGYMVFVSLFYAIVGTYFANKVGRKLIRLNYDQQRYEADFRFNMIRVRENGESIAFYGGEEPEKLGFKDKFSMVIENFWHLMNRTKLLNFYVNGYAQLAVIVPLIMAAPQYFGGAMNLGGLMQTISAFGRVQDALSFFVDSYDSLAQLVAVIRRLGGFTKHMEEVDAIETNFVQKKSLDGDVHLNDVNVMLPDGRVLLQDLNIKLKKSARLLISGESGCGKSTLLRALAGIWPYGSGEISIPDGWKVLFLPQRPYLPLGTLRQAIYYPQEVPKTDGDNLKDLLYKMELPELAERLDNVDDWSRILSLGEQQRIAFIRIILFKPDVLFLDESTSALDEKRESLVYDTIFETFPEMITVSVGHRSSLQERHTHILKIYDNGKWEVKS